MSAKCFRSMKSEAPHIMLVSAKISDASLALNVPVFLE